MKKFFTFVNSEGKIIIESEFERYLRKLKNRKRFYIDYYFDLFGLRGALKFLLRKLKKKSIKNIGNTYHAIGSIKKSTALIFLLKKPASNKISITLNGKKTLLLYKNNEYVQFFFKQVIKAKKLIGNFSIDAITYGGGFSSQMCALNLSFTKIFSDISELKKKIFLKDQFFFRLGKKKERKKFGLKKARKGFQYSKR